MEQVDATGPRKLSTPEKRLRRAKFRRAFKQLGRHIQWQLRTGYCGCGPS